MERIKSALCNKTLFGALSVLLVWYILYLTLNTPAIPSPYAAFINFVAIFPQLWIHLMVSLWRIALAVLISLILGSIIGLWSGMDRRVDGIVSPIVYILYPLPKIAFLPILMILFGLGDTPKVVLIILIIISQFIIAMRDGVKEIPKELFYSAESLGLSTSQIYRHLIVPAVMPRVISALRIGVGVSISVLFFGENFATTYGIGYFIMNSWVMASYVDMFSGILALSIIGLVIFKLIDLLDDRLCAWTRL